MGVAALWEREAAVNLPSAVARKTPGGVNSRGAALLADSKLTFSCDQGVIGARGVDDQVRLAGSTRFGCPGRRPGSRPQLANALTHQQASGCTDGTRAELSLSQGSVIERSEIKGSSSR